MTGCWSKDACFVLTDLSQVCWVCCLIVAGESYYYYYCIVVVVIIIITITIIIIIIILAHEHKAVRTKVYIKPNHRSAKYLCQLAT